MSGTITRCLAVAALLGSAVSAVHAQDRSRIAVEGTSLRYVSEGTGTPILFVHGAISDHRIWEDFREPISLERRYIAYDQRYFGSDDWPDDGGNFSIETHADDLIAVAEALDDGPVHLVTRSYGGEVGVYAALKRPDLFRSVTHFEPALSTLVADIPGGAAARRALFGRFGATGIAVREGRLEDASLRFLEAVYDLPEGASADFPESTRQMLRENGRTLPGYFGLSRKAVGCDDLAGLKMPTLVVHGGATDVFFEMIAEEMARCQPNALRLSIDGTNHDGLYRKPETFATMLTSFLSMIER